MTRMRHHLSRKPNRAVTIRGMGFSGSVDIVRRYLNELDSLAIPDKAASY
jgi:hypothetical protein